MINKITIKYDKFTTLKEVDDYVDSIKKYSVDHNRIVSGTECIDSGLVINIKSKS
tara:strand:+ start:57 stop:221 length:165 start_codon:yes stop_codon:yes gene_type:complete